MRWLCIMAMTAFSAGEATAGTLSGRVTDPGGTGVHPVDIDVYQTSTGTLMNTPDDTTNATGNYSMQLPTGQYNVVFKPSAGSHLFQRTYTGVNVGISTTLDASLARGQYLTGRVTDTGGQGVALVDVAFQAGGNPPTNVQDHGTDA